MTATTSDDRTRALDARDKARSDAHAANCALWATFWTSAGDLAEARTQAFAARAARDRAEDEWDTNYGDFDDAA